MTSKKKHGYMTLAEHHAKLKAEGKWDEYQVVGARKEEERRQFWEVRNKAALPIVEALREIGVNVQQVADLLDGRKINTATISVLLEHIKQPEYPDQIREVLLRALATPDARSYWDELVGIFEHNTANLSPDIRYVAALALSGAADGTVLDDVIRLVQNKRLGLDRVPLLLALVKSKNPKAKMTLLELRDDPDLGKEVKKMRRLERHESKSSKKSDED